MVMFAEKGRAVLEWPKRMKIALGAAKGLSYLHEDCESCSCLRGCVYCLLVLKEVLFLLFQVTLKQYTEM